MNTAVIALGSNIEPHIHIAAALATLDIGHRVYIRGCSSLLTTTPVGFHEQPDFINGAILVETALACEELTRYLKDIENSLGRVRCQNKYGPRSIDLDVIIWNNQVMDPDFYAREYLQQVVAELRTQTYETAENLF